MPLLLLSCEKEEILSSTEVPSEISNYFGTHFPDNPIIQTVKDIDGFELTYDITLEGNY